MRRSVQVPFSIDLIQAPQQEAAQAPGFLDLTIHQLNGCLTRMTRCFPQCSQTEKPRRRKIKAAIRRQLDYLQRNLDAIDALITSGAMISGLKTH